MREVARSRTRSSVVLLFGASLLSCTRPISSWLPARVPPFLGPSGRSLAQTSSVVQLRNAAAGRLRCRASAGGAPERAQLGRKGGRLHSARTRREASPVHASMKAKSSPEELSSFSGDVSDDDTIETFLAAKGRNADGRRRDVVTVSPEFTALCQAQFEVLASVLGASRCDLYFRREDPVTGHLEFVPAAVYPEKQRVWVVGEGPTGRPATGAIELAGFIPATSLLPEYPFVKTKREGGQSNAVEIKDGGLSVPIEYGSVVLGMLAVWREGNQEWTEAERSQVQAISTSLALAVVLDQKHQWQEAVQAESLRKMLAETLHQVKNSLSAVRMFGKLLLRRLPVCVNMCDSACNCRYADWRPDMMTLVLCQLQSSNLVLVSVLCQLL